MRKAFGDDERVAEVESALRDEAARLRATSDALLAATGWRLEPTAEEATTEPEGEAAEEVEGEQKRSWPRTSRRSRRNAGGRGSRSTSGKA